MRGMRGCIKRAPWVEGEEGALGVDERSDGIVDWGRDGHHTQDTPPQHRTALLREIRFPLRLYAFYGPLKCEINAKMPTGKKMAAGSVDVDPSWNS